MRRLAKASSAARDSTDRHHDREFVAAEPRKHLGWLQSMLQPLCDVLQQQVADPVAERVVDDLETVEIEEQDGEFRLPARHRLPDVG